MLKVNNIETYGIGAAIKGMRNPYNSWDKSDSGETLMNEEDCEFGYPPNYEFLVGENDLQLMQRLAKAGTEHRKFMRMITVTMDITAPLYWWKQFDQYKVGVTTNSCSTMHTIHKKEFAKENFSCGHISDEWRTSEIIEQHSGDGTYIYITPKDLLDINIQCLNHYRQKYLETKDKKWWWQIIQLLPSSYNQTRAVLMNYEVAATIIKQRKNHKLDEWNELIKELENLPYLQEILSIDEEEV